MDINHKVYTTKTAERFFVLQVLGREEGLFQVALDKHLHRPGQDLLWPLEDDIDVFHAKDYGAYGDIDQLPAFGASSDDVRDIQDDMPPDAPIDPVIW